MLALLLYPAGLFTLTLGLVHFWLPLLLDFRAAIPRQGASLRPLRLGPIRYATTRGDVTASKKACHPRPLLFTKMVESGSRTTRPR